MLTESSAGTISIGGGNLPQITIHCEDCVAGMLQRLHLGSVDVVVTSPPYNLGTDYKQYDDTGSREDYVEWMGRWGAAVKEVLADDGSLFLNIGGKPSDPWGPFEVLTRLRQDFELQNVIHWVKSIAIQKEDVGRYPGISGNVSVGHYKPINSPRYINDCHEYIFHLTKSGRVELDRLSIGVEYQDKSNISRWNGVKEDRRCRGNTWFIPYRTIQSRDKQRPHPATFPVKIPQMCVQLHGVERARLVVDPFLGIGNAALACLQMGVDFVGFETDSDYFEQSRETLQEAISARKPGSKSSVEAS
ncbi:MAG: site-specific DNA-methyltransferase [Candidatus Latescibacterota bacterium]|nr:site-specific DNA-methyltransferase [Candidatus Latescibacterota bacterium]